MQKLSGMISAIEVILKHVHEGKTGAFRTG
ncbi:MAG: hypothetical protein PWP45_1701 [Tepidanaerobacteraceae bacterium]|nr:hypothetical protein [Tepidanaerobacteraceae bacterium]